MKRRDWLEKWGLGEIKLTLGFAEATWAPNDADREAAWELYVELLTRITTQPLADEHGDEKTALDSVFALFGITREILRRRQSGCGEFAKLAIPTLNQIVRPFTAKWHKLSLQGAFEDPEKRQTFRTELAALQSKLTHVAQALSDLAQVEDLTALEGD